MFEPQPAWLEEWQDLEPVLLAPSKVVEIDYSPVHRLVLEYFLALLSSGETSLRALRLTEQVCFLFLLHKFLCLLSTFLGRYENHISKVFTTVTVLVLIQTFYPSGVVL